MHRLSQGGAVLEPVKIDATQPLQFRGLILRQGDGDCQLAVPLPRSIAALPLAV
jgi:hypothetical protein